MYPSSAIPPPYQPPQPAAGGGVTRPNTVSLAAGLIMVVVFCEIVVAGMNAIILPRMMRMYDQAGIGGMKSFGKVLYLGYNIVAVLVLIFYVFLGIAVLRGRSWARITTIVLSSVGALCCTCSGLSSVGGAFQMSNQSFQQLGAENPYPGWYQVADVVVQAIVVLVLIAIIISLAVKPSGEFFAAVKARSQGYPGPGYPQSGPPGYPRSGPPGYGGYPPAGGYGGPGY